jgi:hypothetical protein
VIPGGSLTVMATMLWTLIAMMGAVLVASVVDARTGRRELKRDIDALRGEVHLLAERQAEMNGRLDLVVAMAHTHPPVVAGHQG